MNPRVNAATLLRDVRRSLAAVAPSAAAWLDANRDAVLALVEAELASTPVTRATVGLRERMLTQFTPDTVFAARVPDTPGMAGLAEALRNDAAGSGATFTYYSGPQIWVVKVDARHMADVIGLLDWIQRSTSFAAMRQRLNVPIPVGFSAAARTVMHALDDDVSRQLVARAHARGEE